MVCFVDAMLEFEGKLYGNTQFRLSTMIRILLYLDVQGLVDSKCSGLAETLTTFCTFERFFP